MHNILKLLPEPVKRSFRKFYYGRISKVDSQTIRSQNIPMHFEIKFNPEKYLKSLGLNKSKEEFLWIKKLKFAT